MGLYVYDLDPVPVHRRISGRNTAKPKEMPEYAAMWFSSVTCPSPVLLIGDAVQVLDQTVGGLHKSAANVKVFPYNGQSVHTVISPDVIHPIVRKGQPLGVVWLYFQVNQKWEEPGG